MSAILAKLAIAPKKIYGVTKEHSHWLMRVFSLWLITGGVYFIIEGLWRIRVGGGWANIAMLPVGGLCGVLIMIFNENPKFARKKMVVKALYGMAILLFVEFISGYIMNVRLGMNIWDYSNRAFNFMGQISLAYAVLWFFFTPFIIWFDDRVCLRLWNEGEKYRWYDNYIKLFRLK